MEADAEASELQAGWVVGCAPTSPSSGQTSLKSGRPVPLSWPPTTCRDNRPKSEPLRWQGRSDQVSGERGATDVAEVYVEDLLALGEVLDEGAELGGRVLQALGSRAAAQVQT